MATMILDRNPTPPSSERDEVWDGVTIFMPLRNLEHQRIVAFFMRVFHHIYELDGPVLCLPGANVSDRIQGWDKNYREPDVLVVFEDSQAKECDTHLCGGPDFLVEVLSPDDRSREKLPFYAKIGSREVLLIDRDPWQLELYQLKRGKLRLVGTAKPGDETTLTSVVLPLSFELLGGKSRPKIRIRHTESDQAWTL